MTPNKNNSSIVRRDLLIRLSRALMFGMPEVVDRIPLDIKPKEKNAWRCCVYKDRAVLKYKLMSLLGYSEEDETDELTPLSYYARHPKGHDNFIINLITEACSNCPPSQFVVSNFCRACDARPCEVNCPKDAISFKTGKAEIKPDMCVNCGKCATECPYNAIHHIARPCEDVCPVGAVYQNDDGHEMIDMDKCILCGKCMQSCPFGAIISSSMLPHIIKDIKDEKPLIALVAPSVDAQFRNSLGQIYGSIVNLGFQDVMEVAVGADMTATEEAKEVAKSLESDDKSTILSSCCPAWVDFARKSERSQNYLISKTPSPLAFTADIAKEKFPEAKTVFIGPCIAKKAEVQQLENCDYCISFEELGALFVARGIEVSEQDEFIPERQSGIMGKNFAKAGGVSRAIANTVNSECRVENVHGLNKANIRQIDRSIKQNTCDFMEIMSCEDGCLGGCQTLMSPKEAIRIFNNKL